MSSGGLTYYYVDRSAVIRRRIRRTLHSPITTSSAAATTATAITASSAAAITTAAATAVGHVLIHLLQVGFHLSDVLADVLDFLHHVFTVHPGLFDFLEHVLLVVPRLLDLVVQLLHVLFVLFTPVLLHLLVHLVTHVLLDLVAQLHLQMLANFLSQGLDVGAFATIVHARWGAVGGGVSPGGKIFEGDPDFQHLMEGLDNHRPVLLRVAGHFHAFGLFRVVRGNQHNGGWRAVALALHAFVMIGICEHCGGRGIRRSPATC